jgi:sulfonate transport system substrate-binding protein
MSRTRSFVALALVLVGSVALAACGSNDSPSADAATSAPGASAAVPSSVPPGTTLRIGDQLDALKLLLGTSGQDDDFPFTPKYASFVGGPPMLQAFQADAIDVGYVADTPLIFAQAAKQDIVAVAAWAPEHGSLELIAAPGSGIESWADVKGKKVAYQQGTVLHAVVLQGLRKAGLSLDDITTVNLPVTQISAALQSGSVDAAVLAPPLDSAYLAKARDAKVVDRPDDITNRVSFLIASKSAIDDPAKAAAIRDYVQRLTRAYGWVNDHPEEWARAFWVGQYHLPLAAGLQQLERTGKVSFLELPGELVEPQQVLADLYHESGDIPEKVDVADEFDGRFNDAVREAQQGAGQ